MRRGILLLAAVFAVSLIISIAPAFAERTPPGSFIIYRATSGADLAEQVLSNQTVANRYRAHFNMSTNEIAERFRSLEYRMLSSDHRTRVYFIGRGGQIISEMRTFQAGNPMFFTPNGQPILDGRCGNPVSTTLPSAPIAQQPPPESLSSPEAPVVAQGAEVPAEVTLAEAVPMDPEPIMMQVLAQPTEIITSEAIIPTTTAVTTPAVESVSSAIVSSAGNGLSWLGLAALPLVIVAAESSTGSVIIPEPATLLTLGSGMLVFGAGLIRKKRS